MAVGLEQRPLRHLMFQSNLEKLFLVPTLLLEAKPLVPAQGKDSRDGIFPTLWFVSLEADGKARRLLSTTLRRL